MVSKVIMHIIGNRPQFIKLATLSWELHSRRYKDIIIHSGQHYDENMVDIFFKELEIDRLVENLEKEEIKENSYFTGDGHAAEKMVDYMER